MPAEEIFTGKCFPEVVFEKKFPFFIAFEFDNLFQDNFEKRLYEFCNLLNLSGKVYFKCLYPKNIRIFNFELSVNEITGNLSRRLKKEVNAQPYFPIPESIYVLVNDFVIYADNEEWALYANRDFDVGVLGVTLQKSWNVFHELSINKPLKQYFNEMQFLKKPSEMVYNQFDGNELIMGHSFS